MLKKVHHNIRQQQLKKKFSPKITEKRVSDFDSAGSVGILYQVCDEETETALHGFIHFLRRQKISVNVLGYFHGKKLPSGFRVAKDIRFITKKDSDWLQIPNSETARQFMENRYDLLINGSVRRFAVLEHIVQLSVSACKIGTHMFHSPLYDIVIDTSGKESLRDCLEYVKQYLPLLRQHCTLIVESR